MNCIEIIKKYLVDNGYDGLCDSDCNCGCGVNDLSPCDNLSLFHCKPAHSKKLRCEDCEDGKYKECYDPNGEEKTCYF